MGIDIHPIANFMALALITWRPAVIFHSLYWAARSGASGAKASARGSVEQSCK